MRTMKEMQNPPLCCPAIQTAARVKRCTFITTQVETVNSMVTNEPGLKLENGPLVSSTQN